MRFRKKSLTGGGTDFADLDMSPFLDIIFQLIIFFMVSTTFIMTPGLKLTLPNANTPDRENSSQLVITLSQDGGLFVNARQITSAELKAALMSAAKGPEQVVIIRADENVPHGRVVEAMDITRQANLYRIAIATAPVQAPAPTGRR